MPGAATLLQQGWLFIPSAILLGALHGLEPGHAKTMMAAFIVAIRGTVGQAVLLGIAATLSHTVIVWIVALGGTALLAGSTPEAAEPYFRLAAAAMIVIIASWMMASTWRRGHPPRHADDDHGGDHGHDHSHHHDHDHGDDDAHALAHAAALQRRVTPGRVSTGQIVAFGLSGGLIPCAAAITILLLCLQLQRIALGAVLVLGFSVGLAATLVLSGVVAAVGIGRARRRWPGFDALAARAPYLSGALTLVIGLYLGYGVFADFTRG